MIHDPKTLILAIVGGIIPSLIWLWFWLKEEQNHPEPKAILALVFFMGIVAVVFVLPIQKYIEGAISSRGWQLVLWASAEELIKYLAVLLVLARTSYIDEPVDWPIYLITAAVGFAALENILFLLKPLAIDTAAVRLLTGELRFLGATLLHTVSSGILGIALAFSLHYVGVKRKFYIFIGLILAIALHSTFNFFIIRNGGSDFLRVFAFLWVTAVVMMLLFEKVKRMN